MAVRFNGLSVHQGYKAMIIGIVQYCLEMPKLTLLTLGPNRYVMESSAMNAFNCYMNWSRLIQCIDLGDEASQFHQLPYDVARTRHPNVVVSI